MPIKNFKEKAPKLFKDLKQKLGALLKDTEQIKEILNLIKVAEGHLENKEIDLAEEKYEEANSRLNKLVRPLTIQLLKLQFAYLIILLIVAYLTYKFPNYGLWRGIISNGSIAVWYGALGGITIGIYGIYNHTKIGNFDPRFYLWYICKPIIGGIFGWFIYIIYLIGILAGQKLDNIDNPAFVYVLAFLGGFSERFSVKMLDKVMSVLTTFDESTDKDKDKNEDENNAK